MLVVFFFGALAHLLMYTQTNMHILQLALCGDCGCSCVFMWWWWLYVVVVAALGGDCHLCVAVVVLLYDCICAWWLWSIVNEDAT